MALLLTALFVVGSLTSLVAQAPGVPLGSGRPDTAGVTRVSLRDDERTAVVKVTFVAGAKEPPHHHPYDVLLIPLTVGTVDFTVSGRQITLFAPGTVQFIPRGEVHWLANNGRDTLEFITVALK